MDLFVFPSHTDTFGNVVLEALASGVPAIVTPDGGPCTIVRDGETGRIVPDEISQPPSPVSCRSCASPRCAAPRAPTPSPPVGIRSSKASTPSTKPSFRVLHWQRNRMNGQISTLRQWVSS